MVAYRAQDGGRTWFRYEPEFDDGRFEALPDLHQPAPEGDEDDSFRWLISFLIVQGFQRVETLNPDADKHFYWECKLCGGTDEGRVLPKSDINLVSHGRTCSLAKHLGRLRALAPPYLPAAITAAEQRARREAIEECAQIAEAHIAAPSLSNAASHRNLVAREIAKGIRALADTGEQEGER
jgi:hypothetical protein